ncbi:hypothetical protein CSKR_203484 [Clonorchis sinensis]|uniref:Uncharacterized protein n=1 Tax=Clonorchis sinensis TaxID=79923 RepID=A0A8T1MAS0_CLOSI|nr:hypothetical protein CSKR_203484 [Clonorchis sinensis]
MKIHFSSSVAPELSRLPDLSVNICRLYGAVLLTPRYTHRFISERERERSELRALSWLTAFTFVFDSSCFEGPLFAPSIGAKNFRVHHFSDGPICYFLTVL